MIVTCFVRARMRSLLSRKKTEIEREGEKRKSSRKKTSSINFELEVRKTKFPRRRTREFLFLPCLIKGGGEDTREIYFSNKPGWKSSERTLLHARGKHTRELGLTLTRATGPWEWRRERQRWGCFSSPSEAVNPSGGESAELRANNWPVGARLLRACPRHWLSKTKVRKCLTSSVVGSVGSVGRSIGRFGSIRFGSVRFGSAHGTTPLLPRRVLH